MDQSKHLFYPECMGRRKRGAESKEKEDLKPMSAIALVRWGETSEVAKVFASCSVMIRVTSQDLYISLVEIPSQI